MVANVRLQMTNGNVSHYTMYCGNLVGDLRLYLVGVYNHLARKWGGQNCRDCLGLWTSKMEVRVIYRSIARAFTSIRESRCWLRVGRGRTV